MESVQVISNADGQEYERIEYTPYGELWIEKASTASNKDIPGNNNKYFVIIV
jgi:hypothetical protein